MKNSRVCDAIIKFFYNNPNNMYTVYGVCRNLRCSVNTARWAMSLYYRHGLLDKATIYKETETELLPSGVYYGIKIEQ